MRDRILRGAAVLALALISVAVAATPLAAQQTTPPMQPGGGVGAGPGYGPGPGNWYGPGYGYGMGLGTGFGYGLMAGYDTLQHQAIADALGMTTDELLAARQAGKTIAGLAQERGGDLQTVVNAALIVRRANLEAQVEAGYLTRSQADWLLAEMEAHLRAQFANAWAAGPGYGMFGAAYGLGLLDQTAQALSMTRVELLTQLQSGKSIATLANERGVDLQSRILDPLLTRERAWLQERARLSQAQLDEIMAQIQDQLRLRVHTPGTSVGPGMGYGFGYR